MLPLSAKKQKVLDKLHNNHITDLDIITNFDSIDELKEDVSNATYVDVSSKNSIGEIQNCVNERENGTYIYIFTQLDDAISFIWDNY